MLRRAAVCLVKHYLEHILTECFYEDAGSPANRGTRGGNNDGEREAGNAARKIDATARNRRRGTGLRRISDEFDRRSGTTGPRTTNYGGNAEHRCGQNSNFHSSGGRFKSQPSSYLRNSAGLQIVQRVLG